MISGFLLVLGLRRKSYWKKEKWIGPDVLCIVAILTHLTLPLYVMILISSWILANSLQWYHHLLVYMPIFTYGLGAAIGYGISEGYNGIESDPK